VQHKTVYKFIRRSNEHIYVVFKDNMNGLLNAFKINLKDFIVEEDNSILHDIYISEDLNRLTKQMITNNDSYGQLDLIYTGYENYNEKYYIQTIGNNIFGFKVTKHEKKLTINLTWNYLSMSYNIIETKFPNINDNLMTTYHSNGKIFYKYVSPNILLILSTSDQKTLIATLIKLDNGKVLHHSYVNNIDFNQPISSLFEENLVIISYVKKEKSVVRNELYVIEIMRREIEHSLISLFERKMRHLIPFELSIFAQDVNDDYEDINGNDLIFLTQTYILNRKVKGLYVSKTKINIANKFIILLFENNQVFFIDKRGISPRRPIMKEEKGTQPVIDPNLNSPYIDPDIGGYNPLVALDHKFILDQFNMNKQIEDIKVTTTENESIFLLCTEGSSLACYKVFPDKTFDTLTMNFSYALILLFMFGITVYIY
jgi:hypothetical protein